ncbi:MAG: serine hydrolase [Planctomycetes bacterium]|nr:serine hydrolase [Planctomycetota bacterium]
MRLAIACVLAAQAGAPSSTTSDLDAPEVVDRFVAHAIAWIDEKPDASLALVREAFSDEMKAALSEKSIESTLALARDSGEVRASIIDAQRSDAHRSWTFLLEQEHTRWLSIVSLDASQHVSGWWLKRAPRRVARAELVREFEALQGDWGLSATLYDAEHARVDGVELEHGRSFLPLGSIFKLYVLAELARSVDAGERTLEDELVVDEKRKSLPSGELQNAVAGTKVKLRDAARAMIRISDNTAADHLLFLLGREKVEAGLARCFLSEPARMQPFLSTLEMFAAKSLTKAQNARVFGKEKLDDLAVAWRDASIEERRAWLAKLDQLLAEGDPKKSRDAFGMRFGLTTLGAKRHLEIEWFAKPRDVVALVAAAERGELHSAGASKLFLEFYAAGAPLYPMPGVVAQGYKGGSEPGVFALSTRVVLADGRSVVACLVRSGFDAMDTKVPDRTVGLLIDCIGNLIEGDPVAAEK